MDLAERPIAKPRPVYLNLFAIRQPLPAIVSILHRASGVLLFFFGIPLMLWMLESSLAAPAPFAQFRATMSHPLAKLVMLVLCWGYLHHLLAGVRHLLQDVHIGSTLPAARRSAALVFAISLFLTLLVAFRLW